MAILFKDYVWFNLKGVFCIVCTGNSNLGKFIVSAFQNDKDFKTSNNSVLFKG